MTKQKRLTKDETMAYELVERMALEPDGYIGIAPYWREHALREAYLEGCNANQDKAVMRQAADKIAHLEQHIRHLKNELAKSTLDVIWRSNKISELQRTSIPIASPDTIAERLAITMFAKMTSGEIMQWIGTAYAARGERNERALEAEREG